MTNKTEGHGDDRATPTSRYEDKSTPSELLAGTARESTMNGQVDAPSHDKALTTSDSMRDFSTATKITGVTEITCTVTNDEFLSVVFANGLTNACPILVSINGNPNECGKSGWFGQPWTGENVNGHNSLAPIANNYFSLATYVPDEKGKYRRQKSRFHSLYAVMLDDVGSKVPLELITLPPTWLLETSAGNFQAGYLLREPLTDVKAADALMGAIIHAGLCDPGASGPTTRLARLPIAVNAKHSPPFTCRLVKWDPALKYSAEEISDAYRLLDHCESSKDARGAVSGMDSVWIPRPAENVVIQALSARGLYKSPLGDGKHDITCPWVHEHTSEIDSGTAYFEPSDGSEIGGFKCLHGHCAARHIRELLQELQIEHSSARMKPAIRVAGGEIHRIVDAAEQELSQTKKYFQRGGQIVSVMTDPGTNKTSISPISSQHLTRILSSIISWTRFDHRTGNYKRIDPPIRHVMMLYDAGSFPHLPHLAGIARQPYLRTDGSLTKEAGYDAASGMFGVFDPRAFPVPDNPSRHDAEKALETLQDLVAEFSFSTSSDRSAALAAFLTAAIRPSLAQAPMFHVKAPVAGSGKSYLCSVITLFAAPQRSSPIPFPCDDVECSKLLLAELVSAPAVIEFDNLTEDLAAHKALCSVLTSEYLTGRLLGSSKTITVGTRTLVLSSGNNVGPVKDMTRRCITVHLDPGVETPATREFKRPYLLNDLIRERERYVTAALTIIRAWKAAGCPASECTPLAGYREWSDLCRQPLLWLGCNDPVTSVFNVIDEDPERETLGRLLSSWHSAFGCKPTQIREAIAITGKGRFPELAEVLQDIGSLRGEINPRRIGRWFSRNLNRIVNELRLTRAPGRGCGEHWVVQKVIPVMEVNNVVSAKTVTTPAPSVILLNEEELVTQVTKANPDEPIKSVTACTSETYQRAKSGE